MLPQAFETRMQDMLREEYQDFFKSYQGKTSQSLRVNPLKTVPKELEARAPFHLRKVPWSRYGFYYEAEDRPGKHPYHEAGVYYIQEASAMAPAEFLQARPGERILDLCAAPGGKSTQIAADMQGQGILICNEIHPARARILSENVERMGIRNAVVTNETPKRLEERFSGYFDRILVDAPCSGEGMFRKNEEAVTEWSEENVSLCAERQDGILDCAAQMLKPGGRLVYSTCTFAPEENEGSISRFLQRNPDFTLLEVSKTEGMSDGRANWIEHPAEHLERTVRLWPHKLEGDGHFAAVLQKAGGLTGENGAVGRKGSAGKPGRGQQADFAEYLKFQEEYIRPDSRLTGQGGTFLTYGDQLYLAPEGMPALDQLKVLRPGLHLGTLKKGRFEPSHALALFLRPEEVGRIYELTAEDERVRAYLNGQTFPAEGEKGWYLMAVDGYSLGWGKLAGGMMKNHYPKGLRKNFF